ncbi:hypothetical protein GCM10017752_49880 [Streptomyces roseoviridis]
MKPLARRGRPLAELPAPSGPTKRVGTRGAGAEAPAGAPFRRAHPFRLGPPDEVRGEERMGTTGGED